MLDSLRHFGDRKQLGLLFALFCFILVGFMDFYMLLFLIEKFVVFTIHEANYVTFGSSMLGCLTFIVWLYKAPRRLLNFLISGSILVVTLAVLIGSLALDKTTVDRMGFYCLCKA